MAKLFGLQETPKYVVIDINDITDQVGLVKNPKGANSSEQTSYRVISAYKLFNVDYTNSVGQISYL